MESGSRKPCTSVSESLFNCRNCKAILNFYSSGGLQPGDIIVAINDQQIQTSQDIYKALEMVDRSLKVTIVRNRERVNFVINLDTS